jgi:hypothetical protein
MKPLPQPDDAELERQLRDSRALEAAPEHVIQRAFTIWQPRRAPAPSLLRQLVAALSFDSGWTAVPAAGVRSATPRQRQLLFTVGGNDIDLRILPLGDGFVLSGQVLGPDTTGELSLAIGQAHRQRVALDAMAEFRFEPAPAGEVRLVLHLPDAEVELPAVTLTAA